MNRSDLISALAGRFGQLTLADTELAAKTILEALNSALGAGSRIDIRGFGSFTVTQHAPRSSTQRRQLQRPVSTTQAPCPKPHGADTVPAAVSDFLTIRLPDMPTMTESGAAVELKTLGANGPALGSFLTGNTWPVQAHTLDKALGGMGSVFGVIIGAVIIVGLPEIFRDLAIYRLLAFGALMMVLMVIRPEGLWPEHGRKKPRPPNKSPLTRSSTDISVGDSSASER